jgi:hypothetical protein
METTHSKTGRTKKPAPKIVVESWDEVWQSLRDSCALTTVEEMNVEGWKTIEQTSQEISLSRPHINAMANSGKLDRIKRKVLIGGKSREINFIRPKATICQ